MVTKESYKRNLQNVGIIKLTTGLFSLMSLVFILFAGQNTFAQGSNVEKQVYKSTKKTTPKKSKSQPKKSSVKKTAPKKTSAKRTTKRRSSTKTKSSRNKSRRNSARNKKRRNSVLVTFNTNEPDLEIWRGQEKLGVTDETAKLETWMPKGNFLVSVKNPAGGVVLEKKLITITAKNNMFSLISEEKEEKPPEPTAEQSLNEKMEVTADVAEQITNILKRYGNPLETSTVSLTDWEFVYANAQANTTKNFTAIQIEVQRWFSTGQIELAKGNYANANTAFMEAVKFMPDSAYPYYAIGETYIANKKGNDALLAYRKAVEIDPKFALAHRKIGTILLESNRTKDSVISFRTAIKNGFDTSDIRFDLAKSYMNNKSWKEAASELERVVGEAPTADVYLKLGELYTNQKRNISAYESYKKATELSPTSAEAFFRLGKVLFEEKEYQRAKLIFEKSVELDEKGKVINTGVAKKYIRDAAQKIK